MKLTIGIKALNEARHIERALESALAAVEPFGGEVILADSGSTDGTCELAQKYPVKIVRFADLNDRCCGAGAQLAFQFARGEYFYILDGDMEVDPDFVKAGLSFLEQNLDFAGVGGRVEEVEAANHEFRARRKAAEEAQHYFPETLDRLDCGGLYRSSAIRDVGYFADRNLHAFEEFELAARLASRGWKLTRLDIPSVRHYGHTITSYALLRKRLRSRHVAAPGEVLRGAIGRPHLEIVLRRLSHIRNSVGIIAWWALIVCLIGTGMFWRPMLLIALFFVIAPLAFLALRRGSLAAGCYSFVAWNLSAFGFLTGLRAPRHRPDLPIEAVVLKAPDDRQQPGRLPQVA